ncbi:MAG TPA: coproporphyrinogen dehydrogenase HemZ [Candidatus Fimousia stercorigallinarum]|nr:coproporphyrinogen dehydrogenase HemZ [Candidatus Fimousia stercorigallinarum]
MIGLIQNTTCIESDVRDMIYAFYFGEKIKVVADMSDQFDLYLKVKVTGDQVAFSLIQDEQVIMEESCTGISRDPVKTALYRLFHRATGKDLPWGTLTGVRPTKIALEKIEQGKGPAEIIEHFQTTYHCTRQKAEICTKVAEYEYEILKGIEYEDQYSLYIGIPFCPSTCLYCSFTSYPIASYRSRVDEYLDAVIKELDFVNRTYSHKKLISIYIGGGTPTSMDAAQLERLLKSIRERFDFSHVREFTVEAGRPDSITREKLEVLLKCGVTRISINPQTMNQETLNLIGRAHTVEQTIRAFELAREVGHQNINMDMIVGLPGEDIRHVERTLDQIYQLKPDSLTVHSLAVKRAANLNIQMEKYRSMIKGATNEMLERVDEYAGKLGLSPYYLYRQKNIPGNLENIGYSKPGLECIYNILIMEEKQDIIAVGAGASSKFIFKDRAMRIQRAENVKNVDQYISRVDEMIKRKQKMMEDTY